MWKRICTAAAVALAPGIALAAGTGLTDMERQWIQAGEPVLAHARSAQLPLDIIVQPNDQPGAAPLALAYIAHRCKLVLSMRGNPEAETPLKDVPAELVPVVIETMVAHEVGHCWRYVRGAWQTVPAGFTDPQSAHLSGSPFRRRWEDMRQTRREEGFADLVGLAWVRQQHPQHYAKVFDWLHQIRDEPHVPGSHHDTHAWIRLAREPSAFGAHGSLFEQAQALWEDGLHADAH